jgi:alkylation response protein AidB-like acyl-CoA dehydrogenase
MNFGFTEEQELLRKTARGFLAEHAAIGCAREVLARGATHAPELWSRLAELGWTGLCVPEAHGGSGLSEVDLCILLEELGRSLAPVPFLPHTIATSAILEQGSERERATWLPELAAGRAIGTLGLQSPDADAQRGGLIAREQAGGWVLDGTLQLVPDAASAQLLVAQAQVAGGSRLLVVPLAARGIRIRPLQALDPLRPLYAVECSGVALPADALLRGGSVADSGLEWVRDCALLRISAEMLGGADRCLESAVRYAGLRIQFGKPIGVHQAIKHKCADMLFAIEASRSIVYYAAWAARERHPDAGVLAAMAKATAGDAYRRAAADNLQIHGGVGFTWEYDCHLYLRRARSDDAWLGGASRQRERIAEALGFGAPAGAPHSV